jgi:acyl carrier protein
VTTLDGAEFYRRSARFGVEYAPRTQVLTRLSLSADRCDTRADAEATDDAVPLTVVDAAFQSLSAACFASTGRAVLGIRSVDAVRVHARLTGATAQTDIRVVARDTTWARADITIRDRRSGHVVADILGVVCEYADVTERAAGPVADAAPVPPAGEITVAEVSRYLQRTISAILRLPAGTAIDTTALFSEMGFDSLMAMYLSTLIEQRWAITVTVSRMLECGHVDALSAAIVQQRAAPEAASSHGPQFVEGEL